MRLILNTGFPTLNEYININRKNKFLAAKLKKETENKIIYLAKSFNFKLPENTLFDVHFTWYKPNNRHDHDNISFAKKFVFDGLIKAGSLKNDSPKFINNFSDFFEICKNRNYISCIVDFIPIKKK